MGVCGTQTQMCSTTEQLLIAQDSDLGAVPWNPREGAVSTQGLTAGISLSSRLLMPQLPPLDLNFIKMQMASPGSA